MSLINYFTSALVPALVLAAASSAGAAINIRGGDLRSVGDVPNGTLLKTIPVGLSGEDRYEVIPSFPLWDAPRGIFKSSIPGIGFSLCRQETDICFIPGDARIEAGKFYQLRIYKTGSLKGGIYSPGTLLLLSQGQRRVPVTLAHLVVHHPACSATRKTVEVTFPSTALTYTKERLAQAAFTLPVICRAPEDYRNVMVNFTYGGRKYDETTLQTNLEGLGIRLSDAEGQPVHFGQSVPAAPGKPEFVANLIHLPGRRIEAGEINVSATATISMR